MRTKKLPWICSEENIVHAVNNVVLIQKFENWRGGVRIGQRRSPEISPRVEGNESIRPLYITFSYSTQHAGTTICEPQRSAHRRRSIRLSAAERGGSTSSHISPSGQFKA